jgi:hypothetical protein
MGGDVGREPDSGRPWPRHILSLVLFGIGSGSLGCGAGDGPSPLDAGFTVRDSAGVTIVENHFPLWEEGEGWRLSAEPLLSLGVMDGPEEYVFFRAWTAMQLGDGRIAVANTGSQEIRFFDAQGAFLYAVGSQGDGPGEFRSMGYTWRSDADSLFIYDIGLRRLSIFDENGRFSRTFLFGEETGKFVFPDDLFGDGTLLGSIDEQDQGYSSDLGPVRGQSRYGHFDQEGRLVRFLALLPGADLYKGVHPDGSGFTTAADHAVRPHAAAGRGKWYYGPGDAFEIQEWDVEGRLLKLIRLDRTRRSMPQAVVARREESLREMAPQAAALWGNIPLPEFLPAHEMLMVDGTGNLWVQEYTVLDEPVRWSIFDATGRWLGELTIPEKGRVTEVGEDHLLGIWSDSLGVQTVRRYGLEKGDPA